MAAEREVAANLIKLMLAGEEESVQVLGGWDAAGLTVSGKEEEDAISVCDGWE